MKLITAYIKPERLNAVKQELLKREVINLSVTNAMGCGRQRGFQETYRGAEKEVTLRQKVRLEIAVNEDFVQPTIDGIIAGARTTEMGDGIIFVTELVDCIRIRTGDTGPEAIG